MLFPAIKMRNNTAPGAVDPQLKYLVVVTDIFSTTAEKPPARVDFVSPLIDVGINSEVLQQNL